MSASINLSELGSVLLVGAGKMGMAMARGWLKAGLPPRSLILVDPSPSDAATDFAGEHGLLLLAKMPSEPVNILVLAVKPQIMEAVLGEAKNAIVADTLVLSIAAGISLEKLTKGLGSMRVVRTMPNTPAQVGKGVTGAVAGDAVTETDRQSTEALLSAAGKVIWFADEGHLDAVTAVSGSGPAYVFHLVEAMAAAAEAQGLSAEASMVLARQTVIGAAALMEADPTPAKQLRENVTSPGGTTAAALDVLMGDDGMKALLSKAMNAARDKSIALGD